jgi:hypothetical protein
MAEFHEFGRIIGVGMVVDKGREGKLKVPMAE